MQLQTASRKKAKIKCALQGPSSSGKTMSALLIAYGLCNSWEHIAVIDTENRSADLYAHLGAYKVLPLEPLYSPESYIDAINVCLRAGIQVIIIDSSSMEWEFLLDYHASLQGNSFTNWNKVTPRHQAFVNTILQADVHIIATIRSKTEYVLSEKNGKQVPEKVGMKGVQRENLEYEFTLVFELDITNKARATKDRTGIFFHKPEFIPSIETGKKILAWCNQGESIHELGDISDRINACKSLTELLKLYQYTLPEDQLLYHEKFSEKRQLLEKSTGLLKPINNHKQLANGTT